MMAKEAECAKHLEAEMKDLTAEHAAEIRRLKAMAKEAGAASNHINDHVRKQIYDDSY